MKRRLGYTMILSAMLTAGCGMMEVDWAPVEIYIEAVDAEGNSIISPHMPGMTLTFKGKTYTVRDAGAPMELQTRTYDAILSGLVARPLDETDGKVVYQLVFGEIDGAADMDEDIRLNWPDGSEDVIHYHCSNHREWPSLDCKRSWKLNGKQHDGCVFRFTGKSLPGE